MPACHPTAVVESTQVSPDAVIDAYVVIGPHVVIGPGVHVHAGAVLMGEVEIGADTEVFPAAVVGKPRAKSLALSRRDSQVGSVRIGARCSIGAHAVTSEHVSIGDDCLVGDGASIREHCTIGSRAIVGRAVSMHPDCRVEDGTRFLDGSHVATASQIGRDCFISVGVMIVGDPALGREPFDPERVRGPRLGDRVAVGAGAILLSGIVIGDESNRCGGSGGDSRCGRRHPHAGSSSARAAIAELTCGSSSCETTGAVSKSQPTRGWPPCARGSRSS